MIACFLSNISAKYYKNPSMLSRVIAKNVGDVFFETQCVIKIIVPSSRLAIWHVQFVAVSTSWVTGACREDVFSIYICEAK